MLISHRPLWFIWVLGMRYSRDWFLLFWCIHCILTYINLFVDSFQKERSRSYEEPREPFYPPVVNHFINLQRIMPRVKRRPEVNVSSAPSLSRGAFLLIYFRRLPLQLRTNIVKTKERKIQYLESIKIRARSIISRYLILRMFLTADLFFSIYIWTSRKSNRSNPWYKKER